MTASFETPTSCVVAPDGINGEYEPIPEDAVPRVRRSAGTAGIETAPAMTHAEHVAAVRAGDIGSMHSWELVTAVDGPGTRLTVFLAGCPLRCLYCHNPDTLKMKDGEPVAVEDLLARVRRYLPVFRATGGGLTVSGGEPLMQPAFLGRLLRGAKEMGVHTTIDTSGFLGAHASEALLDDVDLVLLDIKSGLPETYTAHHRPRAAAHPRLLPAPGRPGHRDVDPVRPRAGPDRRTGERRRRRGPRRHPRAPSPGSRCCPSTTWGATSGCGWAWRTSSARPRRRRPSWSSGYAGSSGPAGSPSSERGRERRRRAFRPPTQLAFRPPTNARRPQPCHAAARMESSGAAPRTESSGFGS